VSISSSSIATAITFLRSLGEAGYFTHPFPHRLRPRQKNVHHKSSLVCSGGCFQPRCHVTPPRFPVVCNCTDCFDHMITGAGLISNLTKAVKLMNRLHLKEHAHFFRQGSSFQTNFIFTTCQMLSGSVNRSAFLERAELEGSLTGELTRADNLIKCDWQAVSEPMRSSQRGTAASNVVNICRMIKPSRNYLAVAR